MKPVLAVVALVVAVCPAVFAEQAWEIRGDVVAIRAGDPEVVVLRLADGRTVEVPLGSLTESSRAAARRAAAAAPLAAAGEDGERAIFVPGPFGRPVRITTPEVIKDIEADAIQCRSAAEAADVYRLALVGGQLVPEQRAAAEIRLREWAALADEGRVRFGDRWVSRVEAQAGAAEAARLVAHGLELMRLGNSDLAEEELRKASRVDPESGRASFVMGLSYALVARNPVKAVEHFDDVARRDPGNAAALNNLAVLEVLTRRYATAVGHLRAAVEAAADPASVIDTVAWAVKLAGDAKVNPALARNKMPGKAVDELNGLYRTLTQDLKMKPADNVAEPRYLGPDGMPCTAASLVDVARRFAVDAPQPTETRSALGFIVAPGHVVCPRCVVMARDGTMLDEVVVEVRTAQGVGAKATVVAAPKDGEIVLLKCADDLPEPVTLAKRLPALAEIRAVERTSESWLDVRPQAVRGRVATPALVVQAQGRFEHTAVVPRGSGGGPILDATGRVVGMVAPTPRADSSGNTAGFGIPVERILAGLEEHLPDVGVDEVQGQNEAGDAERRAIGATVVVRASGKRAASGAAVQAERP